MNTARIEQIIVASVLNADAKPGPNVCTALSYAPEHWESIEARPIAYAICQASRKGFHRPSKAMIKAMLTPEQRLWLEHPMFQESAGLPMSCAESEAWAVLPHYRNKRIIAVVARCYENMISRPDKARELALSLKLQLGDWL